jgi:hypothetical protein
VFFGRRSGLEQLSREPAAAVVSFWNLVCEAGVHAPAMVQVSGILKVATVTKEPVPALLFCVLLDPMMSDPETHVPVFLHVLRMTSSLAGEPRERYLALLRALPAAVFEDALGYVQQFITCRILSELKVDDPVYRATLVLGMMYIINEESPRVPYQVTGFLDEDFWRGYLARIFLDG